MLGTWIELFPAALTFSAWGNARPKEWTVLQKCRPWGPKLKQAAEERGRCGL